MKEAACGLSVGEPVGGGEQSFPSCTLVYSSSSSLPAVARLRRSAVIPPTGGLPFFSRSVTVRAAVCTHCMARRCVKVNKLTTECEMMESQFWPDVGGASRCSTPPMQINSEILKSHSASRVLQSGESIRKLVCASAEMFL